MEMETDMRKTYNGHKNWNHWSVSLWLNNEEPLYRRMRALCQIHPRAIAADIMLSQLPEKTPDGAVYSISAIRAAMRGI
jgi:hypothetical protein